MANQELLDYIEHLITVETDIATQQRLTEAYNASAEERKPQLILEEEPQRPQTPQFPSYLEFVNANEGAAIAAAMGGFFSLLFLFLLLLSPVDDMDDVIVLFLFCIIGGALATLPFFAKLQKRKEERAERERLFNDAMEQYTNRHAKVAQVNAERKNYYYDDMDAWNKSNSQVLAHMAVPLAESQSLLERLYAQNIIYPKYRNLPALTSIYEYLVTGRCSELSGPNGTYNLYEDEMRKDTVISQLNTVIENLEQIKQNQYMLYQQVKTIQQNTGIIASELHQIKGYTVQVAQLTALNAYYAALNERNSRIIMYHHL